MAKSISEAPEQLIECHRPSPEKKTQFTFQFLQLQFQLHFPFKSHKHPFSPFCPPRSVLRCIYQFDPQNKAEGNVAADTNPVWVAASLGFAYLLLLSVLLFFCLFVYVLLFLLLFLSLCLTNTVDLPPAVAHWHWPGSPMWATTAIDGAIDDDLALSQDWECEDIMPAHNTILYCAMSTDYGTGYIVT